MLVTNAGRGKVGHVVGSKLRGGAEQNRATETECEKSLVRDQPSTRAIRTRTLVRTLEWSNGSTLFTWGGADLPLFGIPAADTRVDDLYVVAQPAMRPAFVHQNHLTARVKPDVKALEIHCMRIRVSKHALKTPVDMSW